MRIHDAEITVWGLLDLYVAYLLLGAWSWMVFWVFNKTRFWTGMPASSDAEPIIRTWVRFFYASTLLIGTGGLGGYQPISASTELLTAATITSSTLMTVLLLSVATSILLAILHARGTQAQRKQRPRQRHLEKIAAT